MKAFEIKGLRAQEVYEGLSVEIEPFPHISMGGKPRGRFYWVPVSSRDADSIIGSGVIKNADVIPQKKGGYMIVAPRKKDDTRVLVLWRFPSNNFGRGRAGIYPSSGVEVLERNFYSHTRRDREGETAEVLAILKPGQWLDAGRYGKWIDMPAKPNRSRLYYDGTTVKLEQWQTRRDLDAKAAAYESSQKSQPPDPKEEQPKPLVALPAAEGKFLGTASCFEVENEKEPEELIRIGGGYPKANPAPYEIEMGKGGRSGTREAKGLSHNGTSLMLKEDCPVVHFDGAIPRIEKIGIYKKANNFLFGTPEDEEVSFALVFWKVGNGTINAEPGIDVIAREKSLRGHHDVIDEVLVVLKPGQGLRALRSSKVFSLNWNGENISVSVEEK